jgi:hypothetical protein
MIDIGLDIYNVSERVDSTLPITQSYYKKKDMLKYLELPIILRTLCITHGLNMRCLIKGWFFPETKRVDSNTPIPKLTTHLNF